MHPIYRQVIAIVFALISVLIACNQCHQREVQRQEQQQWGPAVENEIRTALYDQASKISTNESEKQAYVDCCLSRMKELFPNGMNGVGAGMKDSVQAAIIRMGFECS